MNGAYVDKKSSDDRLHQTFTSPCYDLRVRPEWQEEKLTVYSRINQGIAAVMLAATVAACGDEEPQSEALQTSSPAPDTRVSLEARVAEDAVFPMDREGFSDTYAKLGAAQFHNANDLAHWAAIAAAEHGGVCDRVAMVNVSDRSTRENIVWFADCENKQRIFIEQSQAEDAKRRFGGSATSTEKAS